MRFWIMLNWFWKPGQTPTSDHPLAAPPAHFQHSVRSQQLEVH